MTPPELLLYNSATRKKEVFQPIEKGKVKLYCCGPTVYNYAHIGNLRTYIFEDFLRRTLEYFNYSVKHVVNITDVGHLTSDADTGEDKLEKGALREGKTVWEIAELYTTEFQSDCKKLGLLEPTVWPKATDHIQEQIALVKTLEAKGFTYTIQDGIYFDTAKFPRYADFAKLDLLGQEGGARVSMVEGKRNLSDFALWKFSEKTVKRAMEWDSPWGVGFPGWHIECSAMAMKHLGETLDIHCGGTDHLKVHHTNEIAQSECATQKPFAHYWIHGGWLLESDEDSSGKMSKSKGNFIRLATLIEKEYDPLDFRYFCMTSHYRNYLNFSWEALSSSRESLRKLKQKTAGPVNEACDPQSELAQKWDHKFKQAICDDINLPKALAVLNSMLKDESLPTPEKGGLIIRFETVLNLGLANSVAPNEVGDLKPELLKLIEEREIARKEKDFKRSDEIRSIFADNGYLLKDSPQGTTWVKS